MFGGAYGLPAGLAPFLKNGRLISLSRATFAHELSLVVLLEQIYRAEWYGIDERSLEALIDKGAACDDNHMFTIQRTTWLSTLVDALPNSAEVRQLFSSKGCPGFV